MTKTNQLKTGIFATALVLLFQAYGWAQPAFQSVSPTSASSNYELPKADPVTKYGLPVPPLTTVDDVRDYVHKVLQLAIPKDFSYPEYIAKAGSVEKASAEIGKRYPQFYNKEGAELLEAIKQNPMIYQDMIIESRVVRQIYPLKTSTNGSEQR